MPIDRRPPENQLNPPRPLLAKPRFGEDPFGQRHWAAPDLKALPDPDLVRPGEWSRERFDGSNFGRNIPYALAHQKRRAALELASLPPEVRAAKLAGEAALAREAERDGVLAETHLASQARLQGQIALRDLRQRASEGSSGSILPELLGAHDRLAKEQTKSLPLELRRRVETKLGEVRSWLEGQGSIAEQALGEDRRRRMVDQRLELGEALLAQEPESYEIATSEFESLADGLSLKGQRRREFLSAAQARAAEAALKGHLELNPQDGLEDLDRGRFGAALKAEQAEPWRKLLTNAQRFRSGVAEAEARLAATQERRALAQTLEQASRNEAPLPTLEAIERHHPGRGSEILAAIEGEAQRQAMIGELLQRGPEEEERWLAEAPDATERQRRQEALNLKRQRLQAEPERFLALYDGALAQALERATQEPATHLKQAIQLYGQAWARHRIGQKPGATLDPKQATIAEPYRPQALDPDQAAIAGPHRILPRATLTELAEQFRSQGDAPKRLTWMTALDKSLGAQSFDKLIADWRKIPDAIPPGLEQLIGKAREGAPASMLALQLDALETQEREGFVRLVSDGGGRDGASTGGDASISAATGAAPTTDSIAGESANAPVYGGGEGRDTIAGGGAEPGVEEGDASSPASPLPASPLRTNPFQLEPERQEEIRTLVAQLSEWDVRALTEETRTDILKLAATDDEFYKTNRDLIASLVAYPAAKKEPIPGQETLLIAFETSLEKALSDGDHKRVLETWSKATNEEKLGALQVISNELATLYEIEPPQIELADLSGAHGGKASAHYESALNKLVIDPNQSNFDKPFTAIRTLTHELTHAFQFALDRRYRSDWNFRASNPSLFRVAEQIALNFRLYQSIDDKNGSQATLNYKSQFVEMNARLIANMVHELLKRQ